MAKLLWAVSKGCVPGSPWQGQAALGGPGARHSSDLVLLGGLRPAGHEAQGGDQARRGAAELGEEAASAPQVCGRGHRPQPGAPEHLLAPALCLPLKDSKQRPQSGLSSGGHRLHTASQSKLKTWKLRSRGSPSSMPTTWAPRGLEAALAGCPCVFPALQAGLGQLWGLHVLVSPR